MSRSNVMALVARAKVKQTFTNPTNEWLNGVYVFPLPETAAIDHMEMTIGERKVVGQIHPKKKAKRIFQQAKAAGKKASLLAQKPPQFIYKQCREHWPRRKNNNNIGISTTDYI